MGLVKMEEGLPSFFFNPDIRSIYLLVCRPLSTGTGAASSRRRRRWEPLILGSVSPFPTPSTSHRDIYTIACRTNFFLSFPVPIDL
jgi:hypothetical protein